MTATATPPPAPELPRAALPPGEAPHWRQDTVSGFFLAGCLLVLVIGAAAYRSVPLAGVVCWLFALATVGLVRLRLELDERGFALTLWGRGPTIVVPWQQVLEARAVRMRPLHWPGGRLRVVPARTGAGLRRGPGLLLTLTDGRRLGVMLDEPLLPAGLVNAHLDRLRGGDS